MTFLATKSAKLAEKRKIVSTDDLSANKSQNVKSDMQQYA